LIASFHLILSVNGMDGRFDRFKWKWSDGCARGYKLIDHSLKNLLCFGVNLQLIHFQCFTLKSSAPVILHFAHLQLLKWINCQMDIIDKSASEKQFFNIVTAKI